MLKSNILAKRLPYARSLRIRRQGIAAATAALAASVAGAQITPSASVAVPAPGGDDIVVSAERAAARSTIDRKAYAIDHDLQAAAGSAADVLRNLPSVDVDAAGNVSLRGDSNVQVLIDGKPSTLMSPATRADALQSMSAGGIDRVEVITNPSAQFKPDGSGGIINIVTKRIRKPRQVGEGVADRLGQSDDRTCATADDRSRSRSGRCGLAASLARQSVAGSRT